MTSYQFLSNLKDYKIILASQSPRRKDLLSEIDIDFEVIVIDGIDESYPDTMDNDKIPVYLSNKKADAYTNIISNGKTLVIAADTIVVCDNRVLGKPNDNVEASKMLNLLSGKAHDVITGVTIKSLSKTVSFQATTKVWFKKITEKEIQYYIDNYNPIDKAGAYGIQEWIGHIAIEKIEGNYFNVVGLPTQQLYQALTTF